MRFRRALSECALFAVLPIGLFLVFFHPAILDPYAVGWLLQGTDNGENALGLHAWLNDPGKGASLRTTLLNAPEGVTLLFTDSNPLLALVVRPVAAMLGAGVQVVGIWYLLCLCLHAVFARALLAPFARDGIGLWLGVALMLLLPTLYASYIHANLFAHWILLWALWIFVEPRRAGDWRWWLGILVVAALVHNYLLFMVAAIWATAVGERFLAGANRVRTVGGALLAVAVLALIIRWHGVGGALNTTRSYGLYGMCLDALWNPSERAFSTLLPATLQRLTRTAEGFQYLGAGMLALLAMSPVLAVATPASDAYRATMRRLAWLVPACVVLTALAVTNQLDFAGRTVFTLPLSDGAIAALDPLRASGRLFWPVAYLIVFVAVLTAYRLPLAKGKLLLGAVVAVQLCDMAGMMRAVHRVTGDHAGAPSYALTRDPRWEGVIARARDITLIPSDPLPVLDLYQEVAWRAVLAGRPMRDVYAARYAPATLAKYRAEDADGRAGRLRVDRLYILQPGEPVPPGAAGRARVIDRVTVLVAR